jgi:hypothetical protein
VRLQLLALLLLASACSEVPPFYCEDDPQCARDGETGVCTFYGLCAFPDADCPVFELRYDDSAGDLSGVCVGDERFDSTCEPDVVEMPTEPACTAQTQSCIDACVTDNCYDNCLDADADPDGCGDCIDEAYVACGNQMGCQVAWDTLQCCYQDCEEPAATCNAECEAEVDTYDGCLEYFDEACSDVAAVCFP